VQSGVGGLGACAKIEHERREKRMRDFDTFRKDTKITERAMSRAPRSREEKTNASCRYIVNPVMKKDHEDHKKFTEWAHEVCSK